jgi:hypothetical protein
VHTKNLVRKYDLLFNYVLLSKLPRVLSLLTFIREVSCSNSGRDSGYHEVSRGFP